MGAMEQVSGEGDDTDGSSNKIEGMMVNTMRRAASVDDLFAPMWQLNVQSSSGASRSPEPSVQNPNASSAAGSTSARPPASSSHMATPHAVRISEGGTSSSSAPAAGTTERKAPISPVPLLRSSTGSFANENDGAWGVSSHQAVGESKAQRFSAAEVSMQRGRDRALEGNSSSYSSELEGGDVKPSQLASEQEPFPFTVVTKGGTTVSSGRTSPGGTGDPLPPSQSNSDDEQLTGGVDERKQKRMLSNRESARRSRLRKQQHLDELRAQVAHLRAENNHFLTKYSIASQRYVTLTNENRMLRSHAMDLSRQLQRLHHTASQHPGGLRALGLQPGHLDPVPLGSMASGHLSPYSQPLVPDLLH